MSWIDRVEQDFEITTGDGQVWKPLWKDAEKAIGFNVEGYEFIGVPGTYVERKLPKGNQIPLEFYFSGENCIEEYEAFEVSAKDSRPWKIQHPFYGKLTVQPMSMQVDHKTLNQSKVNVTVWETIDLKYPVETTDIKSYIRLTKNNLDEFTTASLTSELQDVTSESIDPFGNAVKRIGAAMEKIPMPNEAFADLKDKLRLASGAVTNVIARADLFVESTIALINFPLVLIDNVKAIVNTFLDSVNDLFDILFEDEYESYEAFSATAISAACLVVANLATNEDNTRTDLFVLQQKLTELYETHVSRIDTPPTETLQQNSEIAQQLDLIVNLTISQLFEIALEAKQERRVTLLYDSNLVVLANKYYGGGDAGIDELLKNNDISINDYMIVPEGKEIIYYV
jgi:hypothetical protein